MSEISKGLNENFGIQQNNQFYPIQNINYENTNIANTPQYKPYNYNINKPLMNNANNVNIKNNPNMLNQNNKILLNIIIINNIMLHMEIMIILDLIQILIKIMLILILKWYPNSKSSK